MIQKNKKQLRLIISVLEKNDREVDIESKGDTENISTLELAGIYCFLGRETKDLSASKIGINLTMDKDGKNIEKRVKIYKKDFEGHSKMNTKKIFNLLKEKLLNKFNKKA